MKSIFVVKRQIKFKLKKKEHCFKDPATNLIAVTLNIKDENKTPMIAVLFTSNNPYHYRSQMYLLGGCM